MSKSSMNTQQAYPLLP